MSKERRSSFGNDDGFLLIFPTFIEHVFDVLTRRNMLGYNNKEGFESELKGALEEMISDIDMAEFEEYQEEEDENDIAGEQSKEEASKSAVDSSSTLEAFETDACNAEDDFETGSETCSDSNASVEEEYDNELEPMRDTSFLSLAMIPIAIIVLVLAGWYIAATWVSGYSDVYENDDGSIEYVLSDPQRKQAKEEAISNGGKILLTAPYVEGHLVPSASGHYVEPVEENQLQFQLVDDKGKMYSVITCPCSYGEHEGLDEDEITKAGKNGHVINGISFVHAENGQAPYARVWYDGYYNRKGLKSLKKQPVFAQVMMTQDDMNYLEENLVADPTLRHDSGEIVKLGMADDETMSWLIDVMVEEALGNAQQAS